MRLKAPLMSICCIKASTTLVNDICKIAGYGMAAYPPPGGQGVPAAYPPQGIPPQGYLPQPLPGQAYSAPKPVGIAPVSVGPPGVPGASNVVYMPVQAGSFDAGARFTPYAPPSVPPPPPGCMPNMTQLQAGAAANAPPGSVPPAPVQVTKKKGGFWKGSGGGGYTFW
jgi:hypothetical protein